MLSIYPQAGPGRTTTTTTTRTTTTTPAAAATATATTAISRSQCSLPDLNRNLWIGVIPAGPHLRAPDQSVSRRTSTTKDLRGYTR